MQTKDAILSAARLSNATVQSYLGDFEDADLMQRPGEGCNHIAWQLGHLIVGETQLLNGICPGKGIPLPEGFEETHDKANASDDDATHFAGKSDYLDLMKKAQSATATALDEISTEELDADAPEFLRDFCPTVGDVFMLIAAHPLMHVGQWVPVRRKLGKPIVI